MEITRCLTLAGPIAAQIAAIAVEAFPPPELEPFEDLVRDVNDGTRWLYCARSGDRVLGFAVVRFLPGVQAAVLEYLATERAARNRGLGAELLRAVLSILREDGSATGVVLEVEPDEEGPPEGRQLRARRIRFYERNGAQAIAAVTQYQMPSMAGPGGVPMKLFWLPLVPGTPAPAGEELRRLILSIYRDGYGLAASHPLVRAALSSIVEDLQ